MRSSSFYSIVGLVLCVGAALAGCSGGDDDDDSAAPPKTSGEGQSCTSAADCSSSLICVNLTCVKPGTGGAGENGSGGSGGSGSGGRGGSAGAASGRGGSAGTAVAPVLGSEGESCTKRADCEADLRCYNQRCTASEATGAAGGGGMGSMGMPPVPVLGQFGETCVLPSDCEAGLTCLPSVSVAQNGVGVCGTANTGILPTGKSCAGECTTAADCCQIPLGILEPTTKSCADLAKKLDGIDCDDPGASASLCFVQATYCTCDDTWACTDSLCVYQPDCSASGLTTEGCPTLSRAGRTLPSTCIDDKCASAAPTGCEADSDCEDGAVSDDPTDTCSPDECTCYKANAQCYRKCDSDLDCLVGFRCDAKKTHVCVAEDECADDQFCQQRLGDINAVCNTGRCALGCQTDINCNSSLVTNSFKRICNQAKHVCEEFGCRDDADCWSTEVRMFCIDTPDPGTALTVQSALTD
jgi:hypothetical protein